MACETRTVHRSNMFLSDELSCTWILLQIWDRNWEMNESQWLADWGGAYWLAHTGGQWVWVMGDKIVWRDERQCTCTYVLKCMRGSKVVVESLAMYHQCFGVLQMADTLVLGVSIKCKPSLAANLLLRMDLDQFQQNTARLISYNFHKI